MLMALNWNDNNLNGLNNFEWKEGKITDTICNKCCTCYLYIFMFFFVDLPELQSMVSVFKKKNKQTNKITLL